MSADDSYAVEIGCEARGYPFQGSDGHRATVRIEFGRIERDHVAVCTSLQLDDQMFQNWREHYGIDVLHFANDLSQICEQLEGSARFFDWDGEIVLCLTVTDRMRRQIAIGGQFLPAVFWNETVSADHLLNPPILSSAGGVRIAFEGLLTDQSYLQDAINGMRRFLNETGISTRSPMK